VIGQEDPLCFRGPAHGQTLNRLALEVLRRKPRYSGALAPRLRQLELRLMALASFGFELLDSILSVVRIVEKD